MKKLLFIIYNKFYFFLFSILQSHKSVLNAYHRIEDRDNTDNTLLKEQLIWTLNVLYAFRNNLKEYQFEIINNILSAAILYKLKESGYKKSLPTHKFFALRKQIEECYQIRISEIESEKGLYLEQEGKEPLLILWRDPKTREELRKKIALLDILISHIP